MPWKLECEWQRWGCVLFSFTTYNICLEWYLDKKITHRILNYGSKGYTTVLFHTLITFAKRNMPFTQKHARRKRHAKVPLKMNVEVPSLMTYKELFDGIDFFTTFKQKKWKSNMAQV